MEVVKDNGLPGRSNTPKAALSQKHSTDIWSRQQSSPKNMRLKAAVTRTKLGPKMNPQRELRKQSLQQRKIKK